ncbi:MAG: hypothetical protein M3512_05750 [Bacteroidota bacterium]|nr:hypothetical protein [Bacteroidota bacterium]
MDKLPHHLKDLEAESVRLAALYGYEILDTGIDANLDELTLLAAKICETPISIIVLLDENRQWFKSHYGWDKSETQRAFSFCHYTILEENEVMEVENALLDKRFQNNPLVLEDPYIRYYCGVPLNTEEGIRLGSLCVIDQKPGKLNDSQKEALVVLSKQVVVHFELQKQSNLLQKQKQELETIVAKRTKELKESNDELKTFIYKASHDFRGPLASILGLSELGYKNIQNSEDRIFFRYILETGYRLDETLKNLLNIMRLEEGKLNMIDLNAKKLKMKL